MGQIHKPLRRFGQNYLIDKNIINKFVKELDPQVQDTLIEIGPGDGSITEVVYEKVKNFTAIEVDRRKIILLDEKFPKLNLLEADFLKIDFDELALNKKIRVFGNIPFNITSSILFKLIENRMKVRDAVFIVQDDISKRMIAKPKTKDYGVLTVVLGYFTTVNRCFKISPNVFRPIPKVQSATVHINFKEFEKSDKDALFIKIVKACFGNRRKTLKNSLSNSIFVFCDFSNSPVDLSRRAEELTINDYIYLTDFIQQQNNE